MRSFGRYALGAIIAMGLVACGDAGEPADTGSGDPEVSIEVGALDLEDFGYVLYEITIVDNEGTQIYNGTADTASYGAPNGSILFVGPCVAGPTGSSMNMATVQILDVRDSKNGTTVDGLVLPPSENKAFTCVENQDVRVDFTFIVAREADQGFADIIVDIEDIFCSAKVSCEEDLMPHPETGVRGPTLVTGFACTGGADTQTEDNYVGFSGMLCCEVDGGDPECTELQIDDTGTGGPVWGDMGLGVVDTADYMGAEDIFGKVFHNTSWLLDPTTFDSCEFYGFGFINSDPAGNPDFTYNGDTADGVGAPPAFHFRASIGEDGLCNTGVESCVTIDYDGTLQVPACQ